MLKGCILSFVETTEKPKTITALREAQAILLFLTKFEKFFFLTENFSVFSKKHQCVNLIFFHLCLNFSQAFLSC